MLNFLKIQNLPFLQVLDRKRIPSESLRRFHLRYTRCPYTDNTLVSPYVLHVLVPILKIALDYGTTKYLMKNLELEQFKPIPMGFL